MYLFFFIFCFFCFVFCLFGFGFLETGFLCIALAVLELTPDFLLGCFQILENFFFLYEVAVSPTHAGPFTCGYNLLREEVVRWVTCCFQWYRFVGGVEVAMVLSTSSFCLGVIPQTTLVWSGLRMDGLN